MSYYGIGDKYSHDLQRYAGMFAERRGIPDGSLQQYDPLWVIAGASTTGGSDSHIIIGLASSSPGTWPDPVIETGIELVDGKIIVKPGIVLDPTTEAAAPDTKGSMMYDSGTDELKYYDGAWQIVSAGGLSAHALDGAYHTATGLTVGWVLSADSATTFSWKAPTGGGDDPDAIHDDIANEITAITPKTTLGSTDEFILEDGGASFVKKAVTFANIESSISLANLGTRTHGSLSDAPTSAHHVRYADSEVESVITAEIVDGQSIDNAIDSLIGTHTSDDNAHHEVFESGDFTTSFAAESLANLTTRAHSNLSDAPADAHHVAFVLSDFTTAFAAESLANLATRTHASLSDAPADAHHVAFVLADFTTAFAAESLANLTTRAHSNLSDAPVDAHHDQSHVLAGSDHTATGLTVGWVIAADSATTFSWQVPTGGPGTGTQWTLPVWDTSTTLGDSMIAQNSAGTMATVDGDLTASSLTFTSAVFGTYIPYIVANTGIAPVTMSQFQSLRRGVLQTLHPLTGEKDHFYLIDKQSAWTIGSTGGTPSGENNMFNNQLDSNCLITVADLPYVLTITYSTTITATDVLYLEILGHRLSSGAFTLKEWKVEVRETAGSVWWTVLDRSAVTDPPNIAVPLWISGMDGVDYKYIDGIRLTITSADGSSWAPLEIYLAKLALINTRPSGTPAEAIGALDIVGGIVYGNVTIVGADLTAANIVTAGNVDGVDVSAHAIDDNAHHEVFESGDFTTAFAAESLANLATRTHASLSDAPADAHHVAFVLADFTTAFAAESLANLATRTHASLSDAPTDAHHSETHVLATTGPHSSALPLTDIASYVQGSIIIGGDVDWEALGAGTEDYVLKMGAAEPAWGQVDYSELSGSQPAPVAHNLIDTTGHPVSGLTAGHFLKALTTTTYGFAAHGLGASDVGAYTTAQVDSAIDTDINTHTSDDNAHHEVIEQSDVESIITAEIVEGQSIDNAIDALITTHDVADNHLNWKNSVGTIHTDNYIEYTDAAVESVIDAEIVDGQSIDVAIDALINTHNVANRHIDHSAVTITAGVGLSGGGTIAESRTIDCDITQYTDAHAQAACVSNAAYQIGWSGVDDVAASKNVLYDKISGMDTLIAANTTVVEVEAVITAEIVDGQSIDVAIDSLISNHAGDDNAHHEVFESGDFTTAFAAEDLGNLASRAYSSLTNIPSTFDPTSHGQSAHTGDVIPDANQSFTGTLAMTPIATTGSIFGITSTVTPTGALTGIDIDFTGITDNIQVLCGLNIAMPSSYSGSTDTAAYIAGAGRSVYFCSANYAIGTADDVLFADVIISGGALWLGGDKSGPKIIGNADAMELWTGGTPTLAATFDTSQNLTLASIVAEATDVDKFLVSNSGQVKFRTGAEAYADMDGYVDADAEAVITAELADGQSIDNAIDALISTHNVADRHIDHSTVSVIAGTGLSGGGTIAADRTINCDITQYTNVMAVAAVVAENPLALTYAIKIGGDSIEDSAGSEMIGFTGAGYIDFFGGQGTPSNQDVLAWSTSNSRWEVQAQSGGGGITGSGTANVLTKWLVGGSTIQDSIISDDGSIATVDGALTISGALKAGGDGFDVDTSGNITDITVAAATVDTDKFIVQDGSQLKYRTGAQVLSDIDAGGIQKVGPTFPPRLQDGAVWGAFHSQPVLHMPAADADCMFRMSFRVPDEWPTGACDLKIMYTLTATGAYSGRWRVSATESGDNWIATGGNVLDDSTAYDFPSGNSDTVYIKTIALSDADIVPGCSLGVGFWSDASNTPALYILEMWIEP